MAVPATGRASDEAAAWEEAGSGRELAGSGRGSAWEETASEEAGSSRSRTTVYQVWVAQSST